MRNAAYGCLKCRRPYIKTAGYMVQFVFSGQRYPLLLIKKEDRMIKHSKALHELALYNPLACTATKEEIECLLLGDEVPDGMFVIVLVNGSGQITHFIALAKGTRQRDLVLSRQNLGPNSKSVLGIASGAYIARCFMWSAGRLRSEKRNPQYDKYCDEVLSQYLLGDNGISPDMIDLVGDPRANGVRVEVVLAQDGTYLLRATVNPKMPPDKAAEELSNLAREKIGVLEENKARARQEFERRIDAKSARQKSLARKTKKARGNGTSLAFERQYGKAPSVGDPVSFKPAKEKPVAGRISAVRDGGKKILVNGRWVSTVRASGIVSYSLLVSMMGSS